MLVEDMMSRDVVAVRPHVPARAAAALLVAHGFTSAPVVTAEGQLRGIVTEADLMTGQPVPAAERADPAPDTTAAEVMTPDPVTMGPADDVADVAAAMWATGYRSIPIVDRGRLVGIVSRRDVLRCVASRELAARGRRRRPASTAGRPRPADPVRVIMSTPVATVEPGRTLIDVAGALLADQVGAVLVSDGDRPVGLLSERDLVTVAATGRSLHVVRAGQVMSTDLVWARPDATVREVAALMGQGGMRHVPIGDGSTAVGMVSMRDVMAVLADQAEF